MDGPVTATAPAHAQPAKKPAQPPLPQPLREDLRLHEAAPDRDGAPVWSIQDPVTNRFYRIGWLEFECLLRWPGTPAAIAADIAANTPLNPEPEQVERFGRFLAHHNLLRPGSEQRARLAEKLSEPGWRHWRWWLHHYLFVRVPLIRPQRWLAVLLPWVQPLFSRIGITVIALCSLLGIVLVARQWDTFAHGVMNILTPEGLLGFGLALIVSKTLHELGHALAATHLGVRVSHMGVAFVVLWPMLYTDTSESWRLRSHRQRLAISSAGISVEIALAGLSTLAWALLDDGALRQAMLYLATTGWILSLALNVSPFMRFDGYFILSDILDFPNLHERAGATARTWLRRSLLGLPDAYAEAFSPRQRRALVAFAFATWLYRLTVFLAIALAVYLMFFKVLGIFLLVVEILWFVVRPVWSEIAVWKTRWKEVRMSRRRWITGLLLTSVVLFAMPWAFDVKLAGVAHPERQQFVYAPFPARVVALHPAGLVAAGAPLAQFDSPDLQAKAARTAATAHALDQRLAGLASEVGGIDQQRATVERLREQLAEARAITDETQRLDVRAEFDGTWLDVDPLLRPDTWVGTREPVGVLVDPATWVVDAYVEQRQVARIQIGAPARFRPDNHAGFMNATVVDVDSARSQRLSHSMLDARHGGTIATQQDDRHSAPTEALYRVRLALEAPPEALRETRGQVRIEGTRQSLPWELVKRGAAVLVRESGF